MDLDRRVGRDDLQIDRLGPGRHPTPLALVEGTDPDLDGVLVSPLVSGLGQHPPAAFELAGARPLLHVDPESATVGIVTCGGLCPGLNDVIRSVVMTAHRRYRVRQVLGFRYGYAGIADPELLPLALTPDVVDDIHHAGGTLLGSSRGPQDPALMVDRLVDLGVDALICVGGDGTLHGVGALVKEISERGAPIAVIAIPKTIDNDLNWVERSFGFATGVEEAGRAIDAAHAEARGARNGVGLVKLMGRHSGFIAAHAALAFADVNFCLVPEVPFRAQTLLDALMQRLAARGHAVVVVAEGAGQELIAEGRRRLGRDASGNERLADIGTWLRDTIAVGLASAGVDATVKYIDPSYTIRSCPANASDAEFCAALGLNAVHAALAGRTNAMIGYWNQHFTHVPIRVVTDGRRRLDPSGELWQRVLQATGQPSLS